MPRFVPLFCMSLVLACTEAPTAPPLGAPNDAEDGGIRDSGPAGVDTGAQLLDAFVGRADSGSAIADTGTVASPDLGSPIVDSGPAPEDSGPAPVDSGPPPVDTGPADSGLELPDAATEDVAAPAAEAGPEDDAGGGDDNVEMSGVVRDFQSSDPISGVEVCVRGRPEFPCNTSGRDGSYRLQVPRGPVVMVFTGGQGAIVPQLMPLLINESPFGWNQVVVPERTAGLMFTLWRQQRNAEKGHVAIMNTIAPEEEDGLRGAVVALEPESGAGPLYTSNGFPSRRARSTDSNGMGAYLNVDPAAAYTATTTREGWTCVVPSQQPEQFPVVAGHLTTVTRRCSED